MASLLKLRLERLESFQEGPIPPETRIQIIWVSADGTEQDGPIFICPDSCVTNRSIMRSRSRNSYRFDLGA